MTSSKMKNAILILPSLGSYAFHANAESSAEAGLIFSKTISQLGNAGFELHRYGQIRAI